MCYPQRLRNRYQKIYKASATQFAGVFLNPEIMESLLILKPDCCANKKTFAKVMHEIVKTAEIKLLYRIEKPIRDQVAKHFQPVAEEHGQEVADRNIAFYIKGPLSVMVISSRKFGISHEEFITEIREKVGATCPSKAAKGTIRSLSKDTLAKAIAENRGLENLVHASDSPKSFEREHKIWFQKWPIKL